MKLVRYQKPAMETWPSFNRLFSLREDMNNLFDSVFTGEGSDTEWFGGWNPALDIQQDDDQITASIELPGMNKEDIEISVHDGVLTVSGERKQEKESDENESYRTERFYGKFQRTISLPSEVVADKAKAEYKDGILHVVLPKAEEAKPKKIDVSIS